MKKLFRKELREETKVGLIGLIIFTAVLLQGYKTCVSQLVNFGLYGGQLQGEMMQPLLASELLGPAAIFCGIFGTLLGWLQIWAEKHADLRAYLIHRPIARTAILRSKIAAGLCLYALGAGLPLLVLVAVAATPGRVAAPFEWAMTLPILVIFLTGIVCYFAGMLTGLRQARWYGSRGFGLGLAILASFAVFNVPEFWQALLITVAAGVVLVTAVWGSFQSGGYYRTQSIVGKLALTMTCAAGAVVVIGATGGLTSMLFPESGNESRPQYQVSRDGIVYKVTRHSVDDMEIVDLDGKPLLDKSGQKLTEKEFNQQNPPSSLFSAFFGTRDDWNRKYKPDFMNNLRFFTPWRISGRTLWYMTPDGRLNAYDSRSRQHVGTLETGESSGKASNTEGGFLNDREYNNNWFNTYNESRILASSNTAYLVDLENRALKPVFTATNNDKIGGAADHLRWLNTTIQHAPLVATRNNIRLFDYDGRQEWVIPYQPSYPVYPMINVVDLSPGNRFAVEFEPDFEANHKSGWKLPIHVVWITTGKGITKSMDLPLIPMPEESDLAERLAGTLIMPPVVPRSFWGNTDRKWDPLCLIPAIFCAMIGWGLGRRYNFLAGAQVGWAVFHLLFGLPGFLAFLSVQEWPARESCPGCKKLRVVDREKCPHCGADFAPPEKNGIEIFEPLTAD